jgi:hypothetical protein
MTNPELPTPPPPGPPPAPGVYQPDHQGPMQGMKNFRWLRIGVALAIIVLFFTGFAHPGFLVGQTGDNTASDLGSYPVLDPGLNPAFDPANLDPSGYLHGADMISPVEKAEIDKFIANLNLADVKDAAAMLCSPASASTADLQKTTASNKLTVDNYSSAGEVLIEGTSTHDDYQSVNAQLRVSPAPSGYCISAVLITS